MAGDPQLLTRLARLQTEVALDSEALGARAAELASLLAQWRAHQTLPRAELALAATNLHGYYTALETLCERVARQLDENVPASATWHAELLAQMQVDVPGLRPRVIPPEAIDDLHELRKFRHFFRNAYVLEFDATLVAAHAERVGRIHAAVAAGIAAFRRHVEQVLQALAGS